MRVVVFLLLLGGCAGGGASQPNSDDGSQTGSISTRMNGVYTTMGGVVNRH